MKSRLCVFGCGIFVSFSCSGSHPGYEPETYQAPERVLDQGWDQATSLEWWYTSQGSRVMPYDWYLALERTDSEELVRSEANMERLRFISWPAHPKWNPDGLPIGFVQDKDADSGRGYFGFTCAACHTGQIEYEAGKVIVEGAPAHSDFDRFVTEIGESLQQTLDDGDKFARFADRVLGAAAETSKRDELKSELAQVTALAMARIKVNRPPHPNGYSRLDAFGNIFNEVAVFSIGAPANAKPSNAPVSYPVVWDAPRLDILQWSGAAVNAGIGPYTRNIGQVIGVFGDLKIEEVDVVGSEKLRYKHHINVGNLERLEEILTTLWSPKWPEEILGVIDREKAERGRLIYGKTCQACHRTIDRKDPNRKITATMIPVARVGTDPTAAVNIATRTAATGILEGQPLIPVTKYLPNLGLIDQFEPRAAVAKLVGNAAIGVLRDEVGVIKLAEGLPAYISAAKKNALFADCDPEKEGERCRRPPRYKARPLNGIWASAPFLHNGSVPNLWAMLTDPQKRVDSFHVGSWEMDPVNVGFVADAGPATSEFDTSVPGNSNLGHPFGVRLSDDQKRDLIEYIKTL